MILLLRVNYIRIFMKVSIITTCYNRVKTIKDAIESVKAQTYEDIEYIIVDEVSTDGSIEVIKTSITQGFSNSGGKIHL